MHNDFLRPDFTVKIFKLLEEGRSINLISTKGNGASRLLEDIKKKSQSNSTTVFKVDIKQFRHNYDGFLAIFKNEHTMNLALPSINSSFPTLLKAQLENYPKIFLLLDNFDCILDDKDQRFPKSFFDDLNSIRSIENCSICCVTEKVHNQYEIHYKDERGNLVNTLSWLDLQLVYIEPIIISEIREELNRQLLGCELWQAEPEKEVYVKDIFQNHDGSHCYDYLRMVCDDFLISSKYELSNSKIAKLRKRLRVEVIRQPKSTLSWSMIGKRISQFFSFLKEAKELSK